VDAPIQKGARGKIQLWSPPTEEGRGTGRGKKKEPNASSPIPPNLILKRKGAEREKNRDRNWYRTFTHRSQRKKMKVEEETDSAASV